VPPARRHQQDQQLKALGQVTGALLKRERQQDAAVLATGEDTIRAAVRRCWIRSGYRPPPCACRPQPCRPVHSLGPGARIGGVDAATVDP